MLALTPHTVQPSKTLVWSDIKHNTHRARAVLALTPHTVQPSKTLAWSDIKHNTHRARAVLALTPSFTAKHRPGLISNTIHTGQCWL